MTTPSTTAQTDRPQSDDTLLPPPGNADPGEHLSEYAGGTIRERHGTLPLWLLAVYFGLFLWSLYYMVVYWGYLGPGRI